jgi:HPt (histidine-containing phosphotransfer) domain-containing protein
MKMEWPDYKHFSPIVVQDIAADDTELMTEVVKEFIKCIPKYLEELDTAVREQHFTNVKFVAHKLKGTARFIGAEELAVFLQEMEARSGDSAQPHELAALLVQVHGIIPPLLEEVKAFYGVLTQ